MKKKKKILIAFSVILAAIMLLCASGALLVFGLYKYTDGFESFSKLRFVSDKKVETSFQNALDELCINDESDRERARVIYEAILSNESITNAEKVDLLPFTQYFADNKYLNCDEVCARLSTFTINPNDPTLIDEGISAEYLSENQITFSNDKYRTQFIPHELHHCIENQNLDYNLYGWFGEGFACLVSYEYFGVEVDSTNLQTFFVRGLGEIVGSDILFEVSATGNMDVLINELVALGIDEDYITSTFDLFMQLKDEEADIENDVSEKRRYEAVDALLYMYNTAYDYPDEISRSFYDAVQIYMGIPDGYAQHFYLRSGSYTATTQDAGVTMWDFEMFYNDMFNAAW